MGGRTPSWERGEDAGDKAESDGSAFPAHSHIAPDLARPVAERVAALASGLKGPLRVLEPALRRRQ